ncbi:hypothetical protein [Streptomyces longisporus]|uniref:Uncharacterized protein n=1 Tax=Streptomyces longisporus TaxID=1948 RepID=A0ABN3NJF5_STRLO
MSSTTLLEFLGEHPEPDDQQNESDEEQHGHPHARAHDGPHRASGAVSSAADTAPTISSSAKPAKNDTVTAAKATTPPNTVQAAESP